MTAGVTKAHDEVLQRRPLGSHQRLPASCSLRNLGAHYSYCSAMLIALHALRVQHDLALPRSNNFRGGTVVRGS